MNVRWEVRSKEFRPAFTAKFHDLAPRRLPSERIAARYAILTAFALGVVLMPYARDRRPEIQGT